MRPIRFKYTSVFGLGLVRALLCMLLFCAPTLSCYQPLQTFSLPVVAVFLSRAHGGPSQIDRVLYSEREFQIAVGKMLAILPFAFLKGWTFATRKSQKPQ